ncbi:MAG: UbiD family decarboxylase [Thermodesulfobacteriota bacterium]|nr:UbiD family decarboxylase [Thermodesulfobacteriota bacterium]
MAYRNLRSFIKRLEEEGEIITVKDSLDPRFEIPAFFEELGKKEGSPAAIIENVAGYNMPVVGNLLGSRKRIAMALETDEENAYKKFSSIHEKTIPPVIVSEAPVKEVVLNKDIDILKHLPVLTYHEKDAGPYITQGVVFSQDPESGNKTMGVHRLQVKSKNRLGIFLASRTSTEYFRRAEEKGEPLDVAIAIGVEPMILLASVGWFPFGDKLTLAGTLRGEPLELIQAESIDLAVPAHAMIVLEGKILPGVRETEGPFGESTGYYITAQNPVIEVTAITHQMSPLYAIFKPFSVEDDLLTALAFKSNILKELKKVVPSVQDIAVSMYTSHVIISIKKKDEAEARTALYSILSNNIYIKFAVVVDDDIDIYNLREVEWAISSRFQADRDLIVLKDVGGSFIDPSAKDGYLSAKMGLDATKPSGQPERFEKIIIPQKAREKVKEIFKNIRI